MTENRYFTKCPKCGKKMRGVKISTRLVGMPNIGEGHKHDPNCRKREYTCQSCNETLVVSKQNVCPHPECDWVGKDECFCHKGKKVQEWPEEWEEL